MGSWNHCAVAIRPRTALDASEIRGHPKEEQAMRNLLTRITLGATFATALTFGACFERICAGDLTGRPILERICSFEPVQG